MKNVSLYFFIVLFGISCSDDPEFPIVYNYDGIILEESYAHVFSESSQQFIEINENPYLDQATYEIENELEIAYKDLGLIDRVEILDSNTVKYFLFQDNIRTDTTITLPDGEAVQFFDLIGANAVIEEENDRLLWCKFIFIHADYANLFPRYFNSTECESSDIDIILNSEIDNFPYSDKDTLCSFLPRLVYTIE